MEKLELLEAEIKLLLDNIKRIRDYKDSFEEDKWTPNNSRVVGEFKHRTIALKQSLTIASNITTSDLFK